MIAGRRIAVDMDEVLFPMLSRLDLHYKKKFNKCPPSYYPKKYNYSEYFGMNMEESKEFVKGFYYSNTAYTTQPLPGAVNAMRKLKDKNKLVVLTGRQIYPQSKNVTYYLLQKHFPDVFDCVLFSNSFSMWGDETPKSEMCNLYDLNLLIDDSVENCKDCSSNGIESIVFGDYKWNNECENFRQIESWNDEIFV